MKNTRYKKIIARRAPVSAGFTLVELMVGITVGLMVVMVAIYAIITARKASGTVTDISAMKQQASYVMYVMGTQIRQAGSMSTIADPALVASGMPTFYFSNEFLGFSGDPLDPIALTGTEGGSAGSDTLGVAIEGSPVLNATQTDCLGNPLPLAGDVRMTFALNAATNELTCAVAGQPAAQALAQNVTDFQVEYRHRRRVAGGNTTTIADANGVSWGNVNAVEVCIEMRGTEPVPVIAGATYTNCQGDSRPQGNRLTRVYRSLYNVKVNV